MKIATLQAILSAWFKIAALKMTMGVRCIVALFFSCRVTQVTQVTNEIGGLKLAFLASLATLWGGCCPCVCLVWKLGAMTPLCL
jgi:hypothetical protein